MALCREFDNPDLFITFTSNPKWPEIEGMLCFIEGQRASDRPEIVARIFKQKLDNLMNDIMKGNIFGTCEAGIHIMEFQKRGLPHVHILIWLTRAYKCKTPDDINDLISAEIPNELHDPEGYKAFTEYMLHAPCGRQHKDAPCMIDNQCSKHFPKPYYAETTIDEDGYNAHINVEWCNRSRAIKYLFKYLNKGQDRATIVIQENILPTHNSSDTPEKIIDVDEIKNYLDCRYLSLCEAVWRLFSYDIHFSKPSVIKLSYHLPNQQSLTLHDSQHLPTLFQRPSIKETMFTQWFELNKQDPKARNLTYSKIPKEYVWNNDAKEWAPRKLRPSIGHIVYSNPASGERYYLIMLLNIVKGPRSFEELRTVDGTVHPTFKDACFAYGLLYDDREWTEAISKAKLWASGAQLRDLFVTMLLFCNITNPLALWEQHWEDLADDILHKKRKIFNFSDLTLTDSQIKNYCLVEIQGVLHKHGKSLSDLPTLPQPDPSLLTQLDNSLIREELNYNIKEMKTLHDNLFRSLNPKQLALYERLIEAVTNQEGGLNRFVVTTRGRTALSRFVIPLELMENSTCSIKQKTHLAALMHEARLIIWDEAPMTQRYAFEALDKTLKDILGSKNEANRAKLFGGMPILLGGDFRQILPVIPKGKRQEVVNACINRLELWKFCHLHTLSRIIEIDSRKRAFNK
ncbi:uncharacterized protein [Rutidosis leptorrhynchoides]|uniref:uncharacterized protein n=1 Tax=Rutidosis leptorrhynchoides TaxID=125765 RepID=UPI003A9A6392